MPTIRIPTPLRPFAGGSKEISVPGETVGDALQSLTAEYPDLRKHLYTETGELRSFVNVFLDQEDVRHLDGTNTPLKEGDQLRIVPSVAGGLQPADRPARVDHAALRVNQAFIIALIVAAFVGDHIWLVALAAAIMAVGTALGRAGFSPVYALLRSAGMVRPDVLADNPEPHLFSQGLGAAFLALGAGSSWAGLPWLGWALSWLVVALAALNLFGGFCVGCFAYYWLHRLRLPGFAKAPPPGTFPGTRPRNL